MPAATKAVLSDVPGQRIRPLDPAQWLDVRDAVLATLNDLARDTTKLVESVLRGDDRLPIDDHLHVTKDTGDGAIARATAAVHETEAIATARRLGFTANYQSVRSAAASYARAQAGALVRSISVEQRAAISLRIEGAIRQIGGRQGASFPVPRFDDPALRYSGLVQTTAARVRPLVGLTPAQQTYVDNYRRQLETARDAGRPSAALNRRRLAPSLTERQVRALTDERIARKVDEYGRRWRTHRAETIAATEVHEAMQAGRRSTIETAWRSGKLDARSKLIWHAADRSVPDLRRPERPDGGDRRRPVQHRPRDAPTCASAVPVLCRHRGDRARRRGVDAQQPRPRGTGAAAGGDLAGLDDGHLKLGAVREPDDEAVVGGEHAGLVEGDDRAGRDVFAIGVGVERLGVEQQGGEGFGELGGGGGLGGFHVLSIGRSPEAVYYFLLSALRARPDRRRPAARPRPSTEAAAQPTSAPGHGSEDVWGSRAPRPDDVDDPRRRRLGPLGVARRQRGGRRSGSLAISSFIRRSPISCEKPSPSIARCASVRMA